MPRGERKLVLVGEKSPRTDGKMRGKWGQGFGLDGLAQQSQGSGGEA